MPTNHPNLTRASDPSAQAKTRRPKFASQRRGAPPHAQIPPASVGAQHAAPQLART
jgi:hypothetical protein